MKTTAMSSRDNERVVTCRRKWTLDAKASHFKSNQNTNRFDDTSQTVCRSQQFYVPSWPGLQKCFPSSGKALTLTR